MSRRREGREAAIQYLYQLDLHGVEVDELLGDFWTLRDTTENARTFAEQLIAGVVAHRMQIDEQIQKYAANYLLSRLAAVDRNILRVAIYEMFYALDVPPVVAINEAIEIAKKFGSEDSSRFVNGLLDRIRLDLKRPSREPVVPSKK